MTNKNVILVLPDLLSSLFNASSLELNALKKILSRSKRQSYIVPFEAIIKDYFKGIKEGPLAEGALGAFYQGLTVPQVEQHWCKVELIEYQADHQTVYAIQKETHLADDERAAIFKTLHAFFKEDGHDLHLTPKGEWYLALKHSMPIQSDNVSSILGKSLFSFMPRGPYETYWRKALTECQMLLATHPANPQKKLSIWFESSGRIPQGIAAANVSHICSDEPSMLGLAKLCSLSTSSISEGYAGIGDKSDVLVIDRGFYADTLVEWEEKWFKPLLDALSKKTIEKLIIYDLGKQQFILTPFSLKFFWRNKI